MTIKEVYDALGENYADCVERLLTEENVARFVVRFLSDENFFALAQAMKTRDIEKAFIAAHTLKGLAQNLGFSTLGKSASNLTEVLRRRTFDGADELFKEVETNYNLVAVEVKKFAEQ